MRLTAPVRWIVLLLLACSVGMTAQAESFQLQYGDLILNARTNIALEPANDSPLYFVLHGTLAHNSMEIVSALLDVFAEEDIVAFAPTLSLGLSDRHGMYPCSEPHRHCHEDALAEIDAWMDWLADRGITNIVLVGHSRGGSQVIDYLSQTRNERVSGALLIAPALSTRSVAEPEVWRNARRLLDSGRGSDLISVASFLHCGPSDVSARSYLSYYTENPQPAVANKLSRLELPVEVFLGSEDKAVGPGAWLSYADDLNSETHMTVIDGADHFFRDLYIYEIVEQSEERFSR